MILSTTLNDWVRDSIFMADRLEPFEYLRQQMNRHNVAWNTYSRHYIRHSKSVSWAMVLNDE